MSKLLLESAYLRDTEVKNHEDKILYFIFFTPFPSHLLGPFVLFTVSLPLGLIKAF